MELRVLRYFLALAREGSISKAAQTLYITQPTLSRQLSELEEELGAQLFVRGRKRAELTEEGQILRRRAEELLELEEKTEREIRGAGEGVSGVISVGAAEAAAAELLPAAIGSFRKKYPAVSFELYSDIADHIKERLDRGLVDVGLLVEPGNLEKYDYLRLNVEDRCGILMSSSSPLAEKEFVTVRDLLGLPVLANKRAEVQAFYRNALGELYDKLTVVATYNLVNNAALFAMQGEGHVFTLEGTVKLLRKDGLCFRPFSPEIRQPSFLVWKKYRTANRAVSLFLDEVRMLSGHTAL